LLWMLTPAQRPEPGPASSTQNYRRDCHEIKSSDATAISTFSRYRTSGESAFTRNASPSENGRRKPEF
jgi:hypothetical protein